MARQPGTRADKKRDASQNAGSVFTRTVLSYTLAGVALAILAGVLLIPLADDNENTSYQVACASTENKALEELIRKRQYIIDALDCEDPDPVLVARLAMSQSNMVPVNALVMDSSTPPESLSPCLVEPPKCTPPAQSPQWLTYTAVKLRRGGIKRGIIVLAMGTLIAAMFLFHPAGIELKR